MLKSLPDLEKNPNAINMTWMSKEAIYDLCKPEGEFSASGVLNVTTGSRTGRSAKDKFVVRDSLTRDTVDWGTVNQPMTKDAFNRLWSKAEDYLADKTHYYSYLSVGADKRYQLPVRVISELAWHQLFCHHMFIMPHEPKAGRTHEWTILNAAHCKLDPKEDQTRSDGVVALDFAQRRILICGIEYAGEMKKSMFSVLNYMLPDYDVLPMHCACNVGEDDRSALFFGLSGTGKTTLSADPERFLVGDDEHGWGDNVFNFEGGCYAKCIDITAEREPVIWHAISHPHALMENVVLDDKTRQPDFTDSSITKNTRAAYPLTYVEKRVANNMTAEPSAVIFLCCDLYGVLPPVARLNEEQAAYYFMSGYTAAVGSTELGSTAEVKPTFSACFGAPFFPRPISVYANLLMRKVQETKCPVFLVNTGWTGGAYGQGGTRFEIPTTRAVVRAITNGAINHCEFEVVENFGFEIPTSLPGVDSRLLNPVNTWSSAEEFQASLTTLIGAFHENAKRFSDVDEAIIAAGPCMAEMAVEA